MINKAIMTARVLFILLVYPMAAFSMEPMKFLKGPIDGVIEILNDPQYKEEGKKSAQRDEIWKTVKPIFNFEEISKRAVEDYWSNFSNEEKAAFIDVFSQLLRETYIDKLQGEYHNEKIDYLKQKVKKTKYADYAEVTTKLLRENEETLVIYRMIKKGGDPWGIFDIIVERVSIVKNYQSQYYLYLKEASPAQLIESLNKKLVEQNK